MAKLTIELLTEELAGDLGYVDDTAAARTLHERYNAKVAALKTVPEELFIEREDIRIGGDREKIGETFSVVYWSGGVTLVAQRVSNAVHVEEVRGLTAGKALAVAAAVTIAALDAEARDRSMAVAT